MVLPAKGMPYMGLLTVGLLTLVMLGFGQAGHTETVLSQWKKESNKRVAMDRIA